MTVKICSALQSYDKDFNCARNEGDIFGDKKYLL